MKTPFVIALLISMNAVSQTKTIYYKRNFTGFVGRVHVLADADHVNSNFGMAPERWVRNSKLDKVTFVNDTVAIMVTSATCREQYSGQEEMWKAGADTVKRHPIFSADISVDSMREVLSKEYYFKNNMEEVEFEGFEEKRPDTQPRKKKKRPKEKNLARQSQLKIHLTRMHRKKSPCSLLDNGIVVYFSSGWCRKIKIRC